MKNTGTNDIVLTGYFPGVLGKITELHAIYYNEHWGFDISFETQVAMELCEFMTRFQPETDGFWVALAGSRFGGAVAIDGSRANEEGARLRWFIVEPDLQGLGIGSNLIRTAVEFCIKAGHKQIYLWTFKGLDPARHLYEREGFRLAEEHDVSQWGTRIEEQMFVLSL
jgi:GNAT superfamily N-acetyltransferase